MNWNRIEKGVKMKTACQKGKKTGADGQEEEEKRQLTPVWFGGVKFILGGGVTREGRRLLVTGSIEKGEVGERPPAFMTRKYEGLVKPGLNLLDAGQRGQHSNEKRSTTQSLRQ